MEDMFLSTLRVVLVLIGVVAAMFVLRKYLGRYQSGLKSQSAKYGLRKVDTIHLGYKKFLSIVEVRNQVLVIGVGDKEMTLLARWEKEEQPV
jgi:flagellar biogenesis protein FliO